MRASDGIHQTETKPSINVTPLIDVLLVLLIIFMVITPLQPSRFQTKIPQPPDRSVPVEPDILTLVVTIDKDLRLKLNGLSDMGSVNDTGKLGAELAKLFRDRRENGVYRYEMIDRTDLPLEERIQKTVYIKAPRSIWYGDVVKVIDGIKGAGAIPIGLQIDDLD